jgi:hypothetical protein
VSGMVEGDSVERKSAQEQTVSRSQRAVICRMVRFMVMVF